MIERAQFAHNEMIYKKSDRFIELQSDREDSFLGWILRQTESIHGELIKQDQP